MLVLSPKMSVSASRGWGHLPWAVVAVGVWTGVTLAQSLSQDAPKLWQRFYLDGCSRYSKENISRSLDLYRLTAVNGFFVELDIYGFEKPKLVSKKGEHSCSLPAGALYRATVVKKEENTIKLAFFKVFDDVVDESEEVNGVVVGESGSQDGGGGEEETREDNEDERIKRYETHSDGRTENNKEHDQPRSKETGESHGRRKRRGIDQVERKERRRREAEEGRNKEDGDGREEEGKAVKECDLPVKHKVYLHSGYGFLSCRGPGSNHTVLALRSWREVVREVAAAFKSTRNKIIGGVGAGVSVILLSCVACIVMRVRRSRRAYVSQGRRPSQQSLKTRSTLDAHSSTQQSLRRAQH